MTRCMLALVCLASLGCPTQTPTANDASDSASDVAPDPSASTASTASTGTDTGSPPELPTGHWVWVNPLPQGSPVARARFADDDTVYAVTHGGGVVKSTDAGDTWRSLYGLQALPWGPLYGLHFLDATTGWVVGYGGRVAFTEDGGATWFDRSIDETRTLRDVTFLDASHGFVVGDLGTAFATSDGGLTWTDVAHPGRITALNSVTFGSAIRGWIGGDDGLVMGTDDGGNTWTLDETPFDDDIVTGHAWSATGVVFATDASIVFSTAPGSWTSRHRADAVLDVHFDDADHGEALSILEGVPTHSVMDGGDWTHHPLELRQSAFTLARRGDRRVLGGWWGALFTSDDGGASWLETSHAQQPGSPQLLDVTFADADHGIAVGLDGLVLHTTDAGRSWTEAASTTEGHLFAVTMTGTVAIAVGRHDTPEGSVPVLIRSTDHGATWASIDVGVARGQLNGVGLWGSEGLVVGGNGPDAIRLESTDDGASWSVIAVAKDAPLYADVWVDGADHIWLSAREVVTRSTDGGATWVDVEIDTTRALLEVQFADDQHGWAVTGSHEYWRTTDGGATWVEHSLPGASITDVHFGDPAVGIAVSTSGQVYGSSDGGITWIRQPAGWSGWGHVRAVWMTSPGDGVIVGTEAKIQVTTTAGGLLPR